MIDNAKAYKATEPKDLNDYLMNPNHAKSEAEWYAARIIEAADELAKQMKSIADNTCCDKCQEAALVAKEALAAYEKARGK